MLLIKTLLFYLKNLKKIGSTGSRISKTGVSLGRSGGDIGVQPISCKSKEEQI